MKKDEDQNISNLAVGEKRVIPVMQEELKVGKRTIDTGITRIRKIIHEREEIVDEPLLRDEIHVERVEVNRFVEGPVPIRYEAGATIVPLLEEVLVVEKRLLLKEELHIRRREKTVRDPQKVVLRSEEDEDFQRHFRSSPYKGESYETYRPAYRYAAAGRR